MPMLYVELLSFKLDIGYSSAVDGNVQNTIVLPNIDMTDDE